VLALLAVVGAVLVVSLPAAAYCRKTTDSPTDESFDPVRAGSCFDRPDAKPLYWANGCVEYEVVVDQDLVDTNVTTVDRARAIVDAAANAWTQAKCPTAGANALESAHIRTVGVGQGRCPEGRVVGKNQVQFTSTAAPGEARALTDVTFDLDSGEVLHATTRVFDVSASLGQKPDDVDKALGHIMRHELGHFLGLAHSQRTDAVMYAQYRDLQIDALRDDDIAGICDAYKAATPASSGGCAASHGAPEDLWPVLAAAGAVVSRRRRRPRASR
jgi:MYXO-CTERM domain-containing protein